MADALAGRGNFDWLLHSLGGPFSPRCDKPDARGRESAAWSYSLSSRHAGQTSAAMGPGRIALLARAQRGAGGRRGSGRRAGEHNGGRGMGVSVVGERPIGGSAPVGLSQRRRRRRCSDGLWRQIERPRLSLVSEPLGGRSDLHRCGHLPPLRQSRHRPPARMPSTPTTGAP